MASPAAPTDAEKVAASPAGAEPRRTKKKGTFASEHSALQGLFGAGRASLMKEPSSDRWSPRENTRDMSRFSAGVYEVPVPLLGVPVREGEGKTLKITEDMAALGTRIWDMAVILGAMVVHLHKKHQASPAPPESPEAALFAATATRQLRVLEVGAGCGLTAAIMALAGCCEFVVTTEYRQDIINHMAKNLVANGFKVVGQDAAVPADEKAAELKVREGSAELRVAKLDWFSDEDITALSESHGKFDWMVVSDCTLDPNEIAPMLNLLERIAAVQVGEGHQPLVLVGVCHEREGTPVFLERVRASACWTLEELGDASYHPEFMPKPRNRHAVYVMRYKAVAA